MERSTYHLELLKQKFEERRKRNPRYSLRTYARFLELHASALSRLLRGQASLSIKSSLVIMRKLELKDAEKIAFAKSLARSKYDDVCADLLRGLGEGFTLSDIQDIALAQVRGAEGDRGVVDFLPQPTWFIGLDGQVSQANREMLEYTGLATVDGLSSTDLIHPDERLQFAAELLRARGIGRVVVVSCSLKNAAGDYIKHNLQLMPMRGEGRELVRWLATASLLNVIEASQTAKR